MIRDGRCVPLPAQLEVKIGKSCIPLPSLEAGEYAGGAGLALVGKPSCHELIGDPQKSPAYTFMLTKGVRLLPILKTLCKLSM